MSSSLTYHLLKQNDMDYKNMYNEAKKRFKAFKEKYYTKDTNIGDAIYDKTGNMQKDFEAIFQEPHESKDERIRQQLLWLCDEWEHNPERRTIPADIGNIKQIRKYLKKQIKNVVVYNGDNYKSAKEKAWNNFSGKALLMPEAKSIHDNGFSEGYQFGIHEEKPLRWTVHDEAVRKEAITCLEEWKHLIPCSSIEDYNNILSWLKEELSIHTEKQQELKPNIEHIQQSWYMEGYKDHEHNREPMWIVKTGEGGPKYEFNLRYGQMLTEQKPAEKQDYSELNDLERAILRGFLCAGVENVPVGIIKETAKDCITQMKPAGWSEEDEKKILFLERLIKYHVPEGRYGYMNKSVTKLQAIAMLKSLHPVKQEWSEDDKRILYNVIAYVGYAAGERGVKDDDFKEANEWLKSLRSQPHWKKSLATADLKNSLCDLQDNYHDGSYEYKILGEAIEFIRCTELRPSWKPSKEQMKALEQAKISAIAGNYITKDGLCSLYEQLKKLM